MRRFCAAVLLAGLAVLTATAAPPAGYYLVWSDEFNTNAIDTSIWTRVTGARRDAVNATNTVSLDGTNLIITTYTSNTTHYAAYVNTSGKFHMRYGYVESRIDYNESPGQWAAFWMQSPNMGKYIGEPEISGLELDICEHRKVDSSNNNIANKVQLTFHWDGYGTYHQSAGKLTSDLGLDNGYHLYGLQITPTNYNFFIDGANAWAPTTPPVTRHSEYILVSSEVEDLGWAGNIPTNGYGTLATSATKMIIDYVRYYAPTSMVFWTGAASGEWTNGGNWVAGMAPRSGSDVVFSYLAKNNQTNTLQQPLSVNSLSIMETPKPVSILGSSITIGAGGIDLLSANSDVVIGSDLVLGASQTWSIAEGRRLTANGRISGSGGISMDWRGTLALAGSNTFSGATRVMSGLLEVSNTFALQNSTLNLDTNDTGAVDLNNLNVMLGGISGGRDLPLGSGNLYIGNNGQSTTFSGSLTGTTASVTKVGAGNLTLTAMPHYSGPTLVRGGKLILKNRAQLPDTSSVYIESAATLDASGLTNGAFTLASDQPLYGSGTLVGPAIVSGIVAPGTDTNAIGTLVFSNALTLSGTLQCDIASATQSDRLTVRGAASTVTLGGRLDFTAPPGLPNGATFTIISNEGPGPITGTFSNRPNGEIFLAYGYPWRVNYAGGDGNDVTLSIVDTNLPWATTLVSTGQVWRFLDDGTDQGIAWRTNGFNDAAWKSGLPKFGFGDTNNTTTVASNQQWTTYFRRTFTLASASAIRSLTARMVRDDGAVVYLNSIEAWRNNMPAGTIGYSTPAVTNVTGAGETNWLTQSLNPALLRDGTNVVAVEIHQSTLTSSDLGFNFELTASASPAPMVDLASPSDGATLLNTAVVTLDAQAVDFAGGISALELRDSSALITNLAASAATLSLSNLDPGLHQFTAVAVDTDGLRATSRVVAVQIKTPAAVTFIAPGSFWKFHDTLGDVGAAWSSNSYNDAAWKTGPAMLGFGDANGVLPTTVVASNGQWTTYFRTWFYLPDAAAVSAVQARMQRDDGAVVYVNGVEVWRSNMPAGVIASNTPASSAVGGTNETFWYSQAITNAPLQTGWNLVAAEVHQNTLSSSDLAFDFELFGTALVPMRPALQLRAGLLSWPADAGTFDLYTATNLGPAARWTVATNVPVLSNGWWNVRTAIDGTRFFKLQTR